MALKLTLTPEARFGAVTAPFVSMPSRVDRTLARMVQYLSGATPRNEGMKQ